LVIIIIAIDVITNLFFSTSEMLRSGHIFFNKKDLYSIIAIPLICAFKLTNKVQYDILLFLIYIVLTILFIAKSLNYYVFIKDSNLMSC
jgi:hypothetical protein